MQDIGSLTNQGPDAIGQVGTPWAIPDVKRVEEMEHEADIAVDCAHVHRWDYQARVIGDSCAKKSNKAPEFIPESDPRAALHGRQTSVPTHFSGQW